MHYEMDEWVSGATAESLISEREVIAAKTFAEVSDKDAIETAVASASTKLKWVVERKTIHRKQITKKCLGAACARKVRHRYRTSHEDKQ